MAPRIRLGHAPTPAGRSCVRGQVMPMQERKYDDVSQRHDVGLVLAPQTVEATADLPAHSGRSSGPEGVPVRSPFARFLRAATGIVTAAAFCLSDGAGAAITEPRSAPPLLEIIELWLVSNFDLVPAETAPELRTMPAADLVALRYGTGSQVRPGDVVGAYDHGSRTIYLIDDWSGRGAAEISVIVHEMVHHLQSSAGISFPCPAAREKLAYEAQDAWLRLFGTDLNGAFGIDPATLLVSTICTH